MRPTSNTISAAHPAAAGTPLRPLAASLRKQCHVSASLVRPLMVVVVVLPNQVVDACPPADDEVVGARLLQGLDEDGVVTVLTSKAASPLD